MKKTLILLMVPLFLTVLATVAFSSPVQWTGTGANNHWYEVVLVENGISWTDADISAKSAAGSMWTGFSDLASITSVEENIFVSDLVNDLFTNTPTTVGPWLGGSGTYDGSADWGNDWTWSDGETWNQNNWENPANGGYDFNTSQPNGTGSPTIGTTYYLHYYPVNGAQSLTWNDTINEGPPAAGGIIQGYVVEYTGSPVPEPATMFLVGLGLLGISGVCRKRA